MLVNSRMLSFNERKSNLEEANSPEFNLDKHRQLPSKILQLDFTKKWVTEHYIYIQSTFANCLSYLIIIK